MAEEDLDRMPCMEVWGSSQSASRGVHMGGLDAYVHSRPYLAADRGGDVYYASSCATGRISRLLLADVAGHGDVVAGVAADLRNLMRQYVNYLDQARFVHSLNRRFTELSRQGCFATALAMTFFAPTRRLSICNAGHPPPLLHQARGDEWSILARATGGRTDVHNIPLGIIEAADYEQFEVELEPGDLVVCYTDALSEARDAAGEMLGPAGLLGVAAGCSADDPPKFLDELLARLSAFHGQNLAGDDVTALLLQPSGKPAHYSFREKSRAALRLIGQMIRAVNPRAPRPALPDLNVANIGGAVIPALNRRWRAPRAPTASVPPNVKADKMRRSG